MRVKIKTQYGNIETEVSETSRIQDLIDTVVKNFLLRKRGHYVIGKQNSVFIEFAKSYTLAECGIKDGVELWFIDYRKDNE